MKLTLVGVNFRPAAAKDIVRELSVGDVVYLRRESENRFDPNAIQVIAEDRETHLGFIAKEEASDLAPQLDEIIEQNDEDARSSTLFRAHVHEKTGAWKATLVYHD